MLDPRQFCESVLRSARSGCLTPALASCGLRFLRFKASAETRKPFTSFPFWVLTNEAGEVLAELEPVEESEEFGLAGYAQLDRGATVVYASVRSTDGSTGQFEFGFAGFEDSE